MNFVLLQVQSCLYRKRKTMLNFLARLQGKLHNSFLPCNLVCSETLGSWVTAAAEAKGSLPCYSFMSLLPLVNSIVGSATSIVLEEDWEVSNAIYSVLVPLWHQQVRSAQEFYNPTSAACGADIWAAGRQCWDGNTKLQTALPTSFILTFLCSCFTLDAMIKVPCFLPPLSSFILELHVLRWFKGKQIFAWYNDQIYIFQVRQ